MKPLLLFILTLTITAQSRREQKPVFSYMLCEAENGSCQYECKVELIKGKKVKLGSYVKVYSSGNIITEGYILQHINGSVFILKSKKDASNPAIYGGCRDDVYSIVLETKQIWGC